MSVIVCVLVRLKEKGLYMDWLTGPAFPLHPGVSVRTQDRQLLSFKGLLKRILSTVQYTRLNVWCLQ